MLLDNFYSVIQSTGNNENVRALITFDREHPIFNGHFPGHPVVPGVCMMQILKEVLARHTGEKLQIASGDNIKFLSIINPDEHAEVEVNVSFSKVGSDYNIQASLLSGVVTFFKFKGTFRLL
jgi:3-hydroxyacyl-[acyl-carrier-protein] dehydratase